MKARLQVYFERLDNMSLRERVMIFLMLAKHSSGVCARNIADLDPRKYIASQLNIILFGLAIKPGNPDDEGQAKLHKEKK